MSWEYGLLDERDALIATLKEKGVPKPAQVADAELEKRYRLGADPLKTRCRNAASREREDWANVGLTLRVHEDRDRLAREGVNNPLRAAMKEAADEHGVSLGVVQRRYRRGKVLIRSLLDDPSEFN